MDLSRTEIEWRNTASLTCRSSRRTTDPERISSIYVQSKHSKNVGRSCRSTAYDLTSSPPWPHSIDLGMHPETGDVVGQIDNTKKFPVHAPPNYRRLSSTTSNSATAGAVDGRRPHPVSLQLTPTADCSAAIRRRRPPVGRRWARSGPVVIGGGDGRAISGPCARRS